MIIEADETIKTANNFANAVTQPGSLKHVISVDNSLSPANKVNKKKARKASIFSFQTKTPEMELHELLVDYFHKPMISHLRDGHNPQSSPYAFLLESMYRTQCDIKRAIEKGVEVQVHVPDPIFITSTKPVLIIDLDETLIHATMGRKFGDNVFTIKSRTHGNVVFSVTIRPHAHEFLETVAQHYTLVLFTAAEQTYADECIKLLDPHKTLFTLKLYKRNCLSIDKKFNIKDLRMFRNIPMNEILILDNNPVCYLLQPANAIPVTSFYFDAEDAELMKLARILSIVAPMPDKQEVLKDYFFKEHIASSEKYDDLVATIINNSLDL